MCYYDRSPVVMLCFQPGLDTPLNVKPCGEYYYEAEGVTGDNRLPGEGKGKPCYMYFDNGTWVMVDDKGERERESLEG